MVCILLLTVGKRLDRKAGSEPRLGGMYTVSQYTASLLATKNYSGKFMVRIPPDIHRKLAVKAAESGVRLNRIASVKLAQ